MSITASLQVNFDQPEKVKLKLTVYSSQMKKSLRNHEVPARACLLLTTDGEHLAPCYADVDVALVHPIPGVLNLWSD